MDPQNNQQHGTERRRGRPLGKNRPAISADEQKARNAKYEKERRQDHAEKTRTLAQVLDVDAKTKQSEVMVTAVAFIRSRMAAEPRPELSEMSSLNRRLEAQIAEAESRLIALGVPLPEDDDTEEIEEEEFDDDQLKKLLSFDHLTKRPRCDNEEEPDKNEPTCSRHQAKRAKLDNGSGSPEEPQPSTSCFDTFLYLTTPPNQEAVTSPDQDSGSPAFWTSVEDLDFEGIPPTT